MEIPERRTEQALQLLCYPTAFCQAIENRVGENRGYPTGLWRLIVLFVILGVSVWGMTVGLLIDSWSPWAASGKALGLWGAAWSAFLFIFLLPEAGPPRWLRVHMAITSMALGEAVFECGIALNLLFYWLDRLSPDQAHALAITWFVLAEATMLIGLCTLWKARVGSPFRLQMTWLLFFHGTATALWLMIPPSHP